MKDCCADAPPEEDLNIRTKLDVGSPDKAQGMSHVLYLTVLQVDCHAWAACPLHVKRAQG